MLSHLLQQDTPLPIQGDAKSHASVSGERGSAGQSTCGARGEDALVLLCGRVAERQRQRAGLRLALQRACIAAPGRMAAVRVGQQAADKVLQRTSILGVTSQHLKHGSELHPSVCAQRGASPRSGCHRLSSGGVAAAGRTTAVWIVYRLLPGCVVQGEDAHHPICMTGVHEIGALGIDAAASCRPLRHRLLCWRPCAKLHGCYGGLLTNSCRCHMREVLPDSGMSKRDSQGRCLYMHA